MVGPARKREAVKHVQDCLETSERRACAGCGPCFPSASPTIRSSRQLNREFFRTDYSINAPKSSLQIPFGLRGEK
jgi:hypothetical protein